MIDLAATIATKGVETLVAELTKAAVTRAAKDFRDRQPSTALNFKPHLEATFDRCTKIKTIVNGDSPIELLYHYVSLDFSKLGTVIDDYSTIDNTLLDKYVVISGAAGSGKSIFMRYLWVSFFVAGRGRIPLFVQLRHLNSIEQLDLLTYMYHSTVHRSGELGDSGRVAFDNAVSRGQFIFIFDGFDELNNIKRDTAESQILKLSQAGKNVIVVSGRPDPRFQSWQRFTIYHVQPLTMQKAVLLIERIDFDSKVKKKFLGELQKQLYASHTEFASRPLLLTIMLLTYGCWGNIEEKPRKMHVFFDQAFDTLFLRHDATKEIYRRQRYTNYSIDDFKRLLSYFSITTYIDEVFEFTEATLQEYIKSAAQMHGFEDVNCELFAKDLLESVSILQRDGVNIKFSHGSFQEYFSAYALVRLPRVVAQDLFVKCSLRERDNVMSMVFDMNKAFMEDNYIDIVGRKFRSKFFRVIKRGDTLECVKAYKVLLAIDNLSVRLEKLSRRKGPKAAKPKKIIGVMVVDATEYYHFVDLLYSLYEREFKLLHGNAVPTYGDLSPAVPRYFAGSANDYESFVFTDAGKILAEKKQPSAIFYNSSISQLRLMEEDPQNEEVPITTDFDQHLNGFEAWLAASDWAGSVKMRTEGSLKFLARYTRERRDRAVQIRDRLV